MHFEGPSSTVNQLQCLKCKTIAQANTAARSLSCKKTRPYTVVDNHLERLNAKTFTRAIIYYSRTSKNELEVISAKTINAKNDRILKPLLLLWLVDDIASPSTEKATNGEPNRVEGRAIKKMHLELASARYHLY